MAAIVAGSLILGWTALMALRALVRLAGEQRSEVLDLVVPALVLTGMSILLALRVPETALLEEGHRQVLAWSLLAVVMVQSFLPLRWLLRRKVSL